MREIPTEVYSRVVGYFRPVNQWNRGKLEEFGERNNLSFKKIQKEVTDDKTNIPGQTER